MRFLKVKDSIDKFADRIIDNIIDTFRISREAAVVFVIACWCLLCVGFVLGFDMAAADTAEMIAKKKATYALNYDPEQAAAIVVEPSINICKSIKELIHNALD